MTLGEQLNTEIIFSALTIVVLLISSALVSGAEVAFFSLSNQDKSTLSNKGDKRSRLSLDLIEDLPVGRGCEARGFRWNHASSSATDAPKYVDGATGVTCRRS